MTRTFGSLALGEDHWIVSELEPHAQIRFKQLFPRVPKASRGPFTFPADPATSADLHWFMQRYPLRGDTPGAVAALADRVGQFERVQAAAERLKSADYVPPAFAGLKPGTSLRPHQAASAEMLQLFGGLLVGDDVGEGKTFTFIAACLLPGALPATIICDPHMQMHFASRFAAHTTLTTHRVRSTEPYALPACDVRIFRWTQLLGWADVLPYLGHGLVAGDEMQELRRAEDSGRGEAARGLFNAALYRLGGTATPVYNYGDEIHNVMSYLRPELLGDRDEFRREWCHQIKPGKYAVRDPKALGSFLREQNAFVRKRKAKDRVNKIVRVVDHDMATMASVEDLARALAVKATTGTFQERGEATRQLDLKMRQVTGIAKAKAVANVVRVVVESGEPVILAGWHREVYDIWLRELSDLKPAMYTGTETPLKKAREMARFLDGETDVFIISLRSGRGVDGLQARSRFVVIGELDWSGEVHHQVIGRADRGGSVVDGTDGEITALFLVADDGSDPPMMEVLGMKASQASGIVDPDIGVRVVRSSDDGLRKLVERYLGAGSGEAAAA